MTKKHYIAIARILNRVYQQCINDTDTGAAEKMHIKITLHKVADGLCQYFKAENPNFDKQRFIAATTE